MISQFYTEVQDVQGELIAQSRHSDGSQAPLHRGCLSPPPASMTCLCSLRSQPLAHSLPLSSWAPDRLHPTRKLAFTLWFGYSNRTELFAQQVLPTGAGQSAWPEGRQGLTNQPPLYVDTGGGALLQAHFQPLYC